MSAWTRHLRLLLRADALLGRAWLDTLVVRSAFVCAGLSALALGLVMLDVAAWLALEPRLGGAAAALAVGAADLVLALLLVRHAQHGVASERLALARDVHGLAVDALLDDIEAARAAHRTLDAATRRVVAPLALALLRRLRRRARRSAKPAQAPPG